MNNLHLHIPSGNELDYRQYDIDRLLNDFEISGIYTKYPWWAKSLEQCLKTGINCPYKSK